MRKTLVIFILAFFLTLSANSVLAKSSLELPILKPTKPPRPTITRPEQTTKSALVKERVAVKKAEVKARLSAQRQRLIKAFFERMVKRVEAAIARLEKLISRIESRLDKIEAEGTNVTDIRASVNQAQLKIDQAKTDLNIAQAAIEELLSAEDPKEAFVAVRKTIKEIKMNLIEAHRILVHLIGNIQGLRAGQEEKKPKGTATPTEEPTPTTTPTPLPTI